MTNAFMQHPVGYARRRRRHAGHRRPARLPAATRGRWSSSPTTRRRRSSPARSSVAAVGAFYALRETHRDQARLYLRHGTRGRAGRGRPRRVSRPAICRPRSSRATRSRCSPRWRDASKPGRWPSITLIGQPNVKERRIDNPIKIPGVLSFLAYGTFHSDVRGLDAFPPDDVAHQHRAALLRLSRHGRTRHDLHRA